MQKGKRIVKRALLYIIMLLLAGGYPLGLTAYADEAPAPTTTVTTTNAPSGTTDQSSPTASSTDSAPSSTTSTSTPSTYTATTPTDTTTTQTVTPSADQTPTVVTPSPTTTGATTTDTTSTGATTTTDAAATTGDATVTDNTKAGDATSGDANSSATIINQVDSTVNNGTNQKAAQFVSNISGNVNGDILLQPMLLKAMLEAGAASPSSDLTVTNTNQLTNSLNLTATSGNAAVTGNTAAGSATSGTADTVANIVNIINSMVAANQSFVGTINIYGNLNGDILIAPDFIPQLLASNAAAPALTGAPHAQVVNSTDTQSIINNVALAAQSGQALVAGNSAAGNATTGTATTNLVLFNLSGHQIVASNSLLVFVNVLGKWVGVIVDAPAGATAAAIGNDVTTDAALPDLVVTSTNQITNNVTLASTSGNATVTGNTRAGSATSGNATASANIATISNDSIGLSGWFGILFINVFGQWFGSFGIDTSAGTVAGRGGTVALSKGPVAFVPHGSLGTPLYMHLPTATPQLMANDYDPSGPVTHAVTASTPAVLAAETVTPPRPSPSTSPAASSFFLYRLLVAAGGMALIGLSALGIKYFIKH